MSEFHAKAPQATASQGLAKGPHMAARAEVEPTTLRKNSDRCHQWATLPHMPYSSISAMAAFGTRGHPPKWVNYQWGWALLANCASLLLADSCSLSLLTKISSLSLWSLVQFLDFLFALLRPNHELSSRTKKIVFTTGWDDLGMHDFWVLRW